ncbi:hypothetical protein E1218_13110 [Kribbella turkmenica]|uniref:Uncharacterized protein n=1 Tax=Kribbella turkmenica TaxID=2530375 RepID=A0A4R4X7W7_9ACTN|nr:hypothetical protein [Kribbella turkmenica]TDD26548.1 hypothetical protein E1218_13110 [Kribbella turkmenica]
MTTMLCTNPAVPSLEVRESWIDRLLAKFRRPSHAEVVIDAYDSGRAYGEHLGRVLSGDIYRPLVEAVRHQQLTPAQLATMAEFIDDCATERLSGGAR